MLTLKEREKLFRKDLTEVLLKHNAEISITDDSTPYYARPSCIIYLEGVYDEDGNTIKEYGEFEL